MSTMIMSVFIVLFVLGFIMLLVIANRLHNDYEEKLSHIGQIQEFIADSTKEQKTMHTITIDNKESNDENVDNTSTLEFKVK